jgi:hypothetical protein
MMHPVMSSTSWSRPQAISRGCTSPPSTVPEPKIAKNRLHLDLIPPGDDPQQELTRLVELGATVLDNQPSGMGWLILADPEGNEFCLEGAGTN